MNHRQLCIADAVKDNQYFLIRWLIYTSINIEEELFSITLQVSALGVEIALSLSTLPGGNPIKHTCKVA